MKTLKNVVVLILIYSMIFTVQIKAENVIPLIETVIYENDFSGAIIGSTPDDFKLVDNNNVTEIKVKEDGDNKYLNFLTKTSASVQKPSFEKKIDSLIGIVVIEMKMRPHDLAAMREIRFRSTNTFSILSRFTKKGEIASNIEGVTTNIALYNPNQWYEMRWELNVNNLTYSFIVNGKTLVDNKSFVSATKSTNKDFATFIIIEENSQDVITNTDYDDIKISHFGTPNEVPIIGISPETKKIMGESVIFCVNSPDSFVYGVKKKITDGETVAGVPIYKEGHILVPAQFAAESLGAKMNWDDSNQRVIITQNNKTLEVEIGKNEIVVNGKPSYIAVAPEIIDGITMIPLRVLAESLGKRVYWDYCGLIAISEGDIFSKEQDKYIVFDIFKLFNNPDRQELEMLDMPNAAKIMSDYKSFSANVHPRILATQDRFDRIKELIKTDEDMKNWYEKLRFSVDVILKQEPSKYEKLDGKRISSSSQVTSRIEMLAFYYMVSGEKKYAERLWSEMDAVASFPDWNESFFLNTSGFAASFAVAYDWLYDYWTPDQRKIISDAIIDKALMFGLSAYDGSRTGGNDSVGWTKVTSNWNVVCNTGLVMGALALADLTPELSAQIVEYGLKSMRKPMPGFAPDGAWEEGMSYWSYTVSRFVRFVATLDSALGTDYGYSQVPGVNQTMYFPIYMTGPVGTYNIHDAEQGKGTSAPEFFWAAAKLKQYDFGEMRKRILLEDTNKVGIYDLLWYDPEFCSGIIKSMETDKYYRGTEILTYRSSFDDKNANFIGFHSGSNAVNHGDLDIGTFVYDTMGERFAIDLGSDNNGLGGYYNRAGDGLRWNYYRKRAEGHNTLVINPKNKPDQATLASSVFSYFESKPGGAYGVTDMTRAYPYDANSVKRAIALMNNRSNVIVQDEIDLYSPSEVYWFMHTPADIKISPDGKAAILTINGKRVYAKLMSPSNGKFTIMDAKPLPSSPVVEGQFSNKGIKKLTVHLTDVKETTISVFMAPMLGAEYNSSEIPRVIPIDEWHISDKAYTTANSILVDGNPIESFVPNTLIYDYPLPKDSLDIPNVSVESEYNVSITQSEGPNGICKIVVTDDNEMADKTVYYIRFSNKIAQKSKSAEAVIDGLKIVAIDASAIPEMENIPQNTVDDMLQTRWAASGEQWISYDLGTAQEVGSIKLAYHLGNGRVSKFAVEVSEDNVTWSRVYQGESSGNTLEMEEYSFEPINARFVRIVGFGNSSNAWNSITEVRIYGK